MDHEEDAQGAMTTPAVPGAAHDAEPLLPRNDWRSVLVRLVISLVFLALLFVTTPFVVRTVQPVLAELDLEAEEAAASLGAGRLTIFRRIVLPAITPAIAAGAALAFARGMGEYGSLVLLSGNLPFRTEVASVRILASIESDDLPAAASVATVLLVVSLAVIAAIDLLQRRMVRRG